MSTFNRTDRFVHTLRRARDWQHRPEFDKVCNWWRDGGSGVCALVGIGGAGKTAIADRFLQVLPGVFPNHESVPKRADLGSPPPIFVFSFYKADPNTLFFELDKWLLGLGIEAKPGETISRLESAGRRLLVFDGLEKVQYAGARGQGVGELSDGRLRDVILRTADGLLPKVSILITTRYPLFDAQVERWTYHREFEVTQLPLPAAVQLLRDRGVTRGTTQQLESLATEQGLHALSVDLVGSYVARFCKGDPTKLPALAQTKDPQPDAPIAPQDREVLEQERRLARIAQRYHESLRDSDPAALELLQRLCVLRSAVSVRTLSRLFLGKSKKPVAGEHLALLSKKQLKSELGLLSEMRLVELASRKKGGTKFAHAAHPAIKEAFRATLEDIRLQSVLERVVDFHERRFDSSVELLRQWLDEDLRDKRRNDLRRQRDHWRASLRDEHTRNSLEDLVWYLVHRNEWQSAFAVFHVRMGGYQWLEHVFSDCARGERITKLLQDHVGDESLRQRLKNILQAESTSDCNVKELVQGFDSKLAAARYCRVLSDRAGFLRHLADLASSEALYCAAERIAGHIPSEDGAIEKWIAQRNLANLYALTGHLDKTKSRASEATAAILSDDFPTNKGHQLTKTELTNHIAKGEALGLQGQIAEANKHFDQAQAGEQQLNTSHFVGFSGVWRADLLRRLGPRGVREARSLLERVKQTKSKLWQDVQNYRVLIEARTALADGDLQECDDRLAEFYAWSRKVGDEWARISEEITHAALLLARYERKKSDELVKELKSRLNRAVAEAKRGGFGIHHVDLLLMRARMALHEGRAQAALDDVALALDTGIPADAATGQPELLAACDKHCGYAWAIPVGLELRGEALLLQAAREVISVGWASPTHGYLNPINVAAVGNAHPTIGQLIDDAKACLHAALDRWQPLHDPEPERPDQNFQFDGKPYNYRAADTHQLLVQLEAGLLTRYPLTKLEPRIDDTHVEKGLTMTAATSPRVFISYTHDSNEHAEKVLALANRLRGDGIESHLDQYVQNPSEGWPLWMDNEIEAAAFVLVVSTERYAAKAKERKRSGGRFESVLILQDLYEAGMSNDKFIPVVLDDSDSEHILKWLRPVNYYTVHTNHGYDLLLRRLLDDPTVAPPPVAIPVKKGPINP